jgi:hypothetical protein
MEPELIDRKEYDSFGECIYCGAKATDVELTDEHVVPYSLGANAVIIDGSCKACAGETTKLEDVVGRKVLWDMRTHIGEQTRRPKERPKTFKFKASIAGREMQEFEVPVADAIFFTAYPVWGLPGILTGAQPSAEFKEYKAHAFYWYSENLGKILGAMEGESIEIPFPNFRIDHHKFARAIAKVAYCQTILKYGLHGFRRLVLPGLILGRYPNVPYFVGSALIDPPKRLDGKVKHAIVLTETTIGKMRLLTASVRLCANSGTDEAGTPIYDVVVGAPR